MKHWRLSLALMTGMVPGWITTSYADDLKVGFHNFPPMMIEAKDSGIYKDIFEELAKRTGDQYTYSYSSAARINELFVKGEIDIEPGIAPIWRSHTKEPGLFSEPFAESVVLVLFAPGKAFPVKNNAAFTGKELGTVRGYNYSGFGDLFTSGKIQRVDKVSEGQLIRSLAAGRIDQILIEKSVALYHISLEPESMSSLELGDVIEATAISMRVHPQKKNSIRLMNKALKDMRTSGVIDQIYQKYQ